MQNQYYKSSPFNDHWSLIKDHFIGTKTIVWNTDFCYFIDFWATGAFNHDISPTQISLFSESPVSPVEVHFFRKFMFQLNVDNTALATKSGIYPATLAESVYWKSLGSMVLQYPILQ